MAQSSAIALTCYRSRAGLAELRMTGLLDEVLNVPLLPTDIDCILSHPDGICVIGYVGDEPIGYVVAQLHIQGRGMKHLFVFQAYTKGHPNWTKVAIDFLVDIATQAQCDAISTTAPPNVASLLARKYGFAAVGMHLVRRLTREH